MREELKRCPFCDSEAKIQLIPPVNPMVSRLTYVGARIGCSNGDCIVYVGMMKPYQTLEDAKREWNRRPSNDRHNRRAEGVRLRR